MTPEAPGEYYGQCAEYCGTSHANMRFRAIVHPKGEFEQWVKAQQAPPVESTDALAQQGKDTFGKSACVGCHTIAGVSAGVIGPNLTHFASRRTFAGSLMQATPENVIKLNVSRGCNPSNAIRIVSLTLSRGNPCIDPDVSIRNTISFAVISAFVGRAGGSSFGIEEKSPGPRSLSRGRRRQGHR